MFVQVFKANCCFQNGQIADCLKMAPTRAETLRRMYCNMSCKVLAIKVVFQVVFS